MLMSLTNIWKPKSYGDTNIAASLREHPLADAIDLEEKINAVDKTRCYPLIKDKNWTQQSKAHVPFIMLQCSPLIPNIITLEALNKEKLTISWTNSWFVNIKGSLSTIDREKEMVKTGRLFFIYLHIHVHVFSISIATFRFLVLEYDDIFL